MSEPTEAAKAAAEIKQKNQLEEIRRDYSLSIRKHPGTQVVQDISWLVGEIDQLKQCINDLQSGMYINCVYCGHRYGPKDKVPATMADALKEHIEQCPKHPMSKLREERDQLKQQLADALNSSAEIAECIVNDMSPEEIEGLKRELTEQLAEATKPNANPLAEGLADLKQP